LYVRGLTCFLFKFLTISHPHRAQHKTALNSQVSDICINSVALKLLTGIRLNLYANVAQGTAAVYPSKLIPLNITDCEVNSTNKRYTKRK